MKVRMLKQTHYAGSLSEGQETVVDSATGKRWIGNGIAELIVEEALEVEEETKKEMTNKELFELCKDRNIELDKLMINGKTPEEKKEYLLSMLKTGD